MINENLQKLLNNKNLDTFYGELLGEKIFILSYLNEHFIFLIKDDDIFKIENNETTQIKIDDFFDYFKQTIEKIKIQNNQYQKIIEYKENIILTGNLIKNFFKKSFLLRQKINKNLQFLSQLNEALLMFLSDKNIYKKNIKIISFGADLLSKNLKELLYRIDNLHTLMTAIKNDKMNKNIYFLSILSSIFLPLNLMVGFFGMNTQGMFLQNYQNGTLYVLIMMIIIFISCILIYKIQKNKEVELDNFAIFKKNKV